MLQIRLAMLLAGWSAVSYAQQSQLVQVKLIHLNPEAVAVRQSGRALGRTPGSFQLGTGVQRVQVGETEHCLVIEPNRPAEVVISAGKIESIVGALKCEDAWSDILVQGLPALVSVQASPGGRASANGRDAYLRIPLPGRTTVSFTGQMYAPFSAEVAVGPRETITYRARLGPAMPALQRDTIFLPMPNAPTLAQQPPMRAEPDDPTSKLVNADNRLAIMRSRYGAESAVQVGAWTFIAGGVAALVYGIMWSADSLHTKPGLGRNAVIGLGVMGVGWTIQAPASKSVKRKATAAGCSETGLPSHRRNCQRGIEGEVERLRAEKESYPMRHTTWLTDRARADSIDNAARAQHALRLQAHAKATADATARNQVITRNRNENERALESWRIRARQSQGLDLVSRSVRP